MNDKITKNHALNKLMSSIKSSLNQMNELSKQAKDPTILTESQDSWKMFLETVSALGTSRHEEAINTINEQIKIVKDEQRASRRYFWQRYRTNSMDIPFMGKETAILDRLINERERHIHQEREFDKDFVQIVDVAIDIDQVVKELNSGLKKMNKLIMYCDLRNYLGLNFRLVMQRLLAFAGKHGFILFVTIFIGGYGYSTLIAHGKSFLINFFSNTLYITIFIIGTYFFKEYVLNKYLKKIQLKWERKLLYPVLSIVFESRLSSLFDRVRARIVKPEDEKCPMNAIPQCKKL
jgi:hypothetical protein